MTRINILKYYPFNEEYYKLFVEPLLREAIDKEIIRLEHRLENSKYNVKFDFEKTLSYSKIMLLSIKLPPVEIYFNKADFSKTSLKILDHFTSDMIGPMWESTPSSTLNFDLVYLSKDKGNYLFSHSILDGIIEIENKLIFSFIPGCILRNEEINKIK